MSEGPVKRGRRRAVEVARQINRHPKLVAATRRTRIKALGDDEMTDRLATARGRPADLAARQLVQRRGESPGLMAEIGMTTLQAWQRVAESQDRGRGKVDVAILFTDLVGFSSWTLEAGDQAAVRLLREISEAVEPPILAHRGEIVKRLGDGLMAVFWDAPSAIDAAFAATERARTVEVDGHVPELRTGIHLGRPRKLGGDYFGVDVNIAARLVDAARPGEILVSGRALEALDPFAVSARRRRFKAKGAPGDLSAHAVVRSD
jgi:adenylate cyclase